MPVSEEELNRTFALLEKQEKIIASLKVELKKKDEKLSEFMDGLPIEKADKKEEYFFKDNNHLTRIKWNEKRSSWCNSLCVQMDYENEWIKTVYHIPSEIKEGS